MRVKIDIFIERNDSFAIGQKFFDPQLHVVDLRRRANAHFAAGFDQTFPARRSQLLQKQKVNRVIVRESARRQNPRVIEDEQIAFGQKTFELAELAMFDRLRFAMQNHHPRFIAPRRRTLGNQFFWKRIIVIAQTCAHRQAS